ncbi:VOC family protein [Streptomyces sparsus]
MPVMVQALQGAPCWVSLMARDLDAAQDFYASVFGWRYTAGLHKPGGRTVATVDDVPVAGLGTMASETDFPVAWTPYLAADDADATASRIRERGGTVAVGPMQFDGGRAAWAAGPDEAVFGIWQGEVTRRWEVGGRSGSTAWLELRTRDPFASALFYGEVFGWDQRHSERFDIRFEHERVVLRIANRRVAQISGGGDRAAAKRKDWPQWHVHFLVADVARTVRRVQEAGGTVVALPHDSPSGVVAACRDREGGLFHLVRESTG